MIEHASAVTVRPYLPEDASAWDTLVERSRSRHFFFKRGYMEYHADRFTDSSLIILDGDELVAVLPASRTDDTVVSHAGLTFGGLVSEPSLTTRRSLAVLAAVRAHLEEQGVRELVYKPVPHIYHVVPNEEDLYALFVLGARLMSRDVSCAIRPDMRVTPTKGRRASLARARRGGLEIGISTDFAEFMALETESLARRHGVKPVHTGEEMEILAERFPTHIGLHVARRGSRLLAGVLVYETETVAHAQYIGASVKGQEEHAIDAVVEDLLNDRYRSKRFFDFGISTEHSGRWLNAGLIRNKESFGARAVVYDRYTLDCSSSA